jgi:hypothetical protein
LTLANNNTWRIWKIEIMRMTITNEFLIHGTLSVAALHLSRLVPSRSAELGAQAIDRKTRALPSFRKAMNSSDPARVHPVFAFAGSLIPFMLATSVSNRYAYSAPVNISLKYDYFIV